MRISKEAHMDLRDYFRKELEALGNGTIERITVIKGENTGLEILSDSENIIATNRTPLSDDFENTISEMIQATPHLVLFGSGHVAKALYDLATIQGLPTTVIDPRPEMNSAERFPTAERIICDYDSIPEEIAHIFNPYFCIFTHGHSGDQVALEYCLENRPAAPYIGMIGSKNKIAHVYEECQKNGFDREELEKVHAPIGIKIGGDSPEEIAISIMAEIISVYTRKRHTSTVDIPFIRMLAQQREGVLCRIISKSGSGPRSVGTMMLVTKDGIEGTIGGGRLETGVIEDARKMKEETMIKHYGLNSLDLEMACGGEMDVLFQRLD